ncbi:MAG: S-layer homology domain-containing protein [Oscillospiraceae bacterium]|nr:S-layer homology domain-containing protein [Oscillospiraceae bacterium]
MSDIYIYKLDGSSGDEDCVCDFDYAQDIVIDWSSLVEGTIYTETSTGAFRTIGNTSTEAEVLADNKIKVTKSSNNSDNIASGLVFEVDLGTAVLGDYAAITYNVTMGGSNREMRAHASAAPPASSGNNNAVNNLGAAGRTVGGGNPTAADQNMTNNISTITGDTAALTGNVWLYIGHVASSSVYDITIDSVKLIAKVCDGSCVEGDCCDGECDPCDCTDCTKTGVGECCDAVSCPDCGAFPCECPCELIWSPDLTTNPTGGRVNAQHLGGGYGVVTSSSGLTIAWVAPDDSFPVGAFDVTINSTSQGVHINTSGVGWEAGKGFSTQPGVGYRIEYAAEVINDGANRTNNRVRVNGAQVADFGAITSGRDDGSYTWTPPNETAQLTSFSIMYQNSTDPSGTVRISGLKIYRIGNACEGCDICSELCDVCGEYTCECPGVDAKNITLTPGRNAAEIGFTWWTPKDTANAAKVQIALAADVDAGEWPTDPEKFAVFDGTNVDGPWVNDPIVAGDTVGDPYNYNVNRVTATGLDPDTDYAYRLSDGAEWSKVKLFSTRNPDKYAVIAVGDPQISPGDERTWNKALTMAVERADTLGGAAFAMSAGDQMNYANNWEELAGYLSPKAMTSLPFMTTVGNHDTQDQRSGSGYAGFVRGSLLPFTYNQPNLYWPVEWQSLNNDQGRGGGNFYFSYGNTLYISINSNIKNVNSHEAFMEEAIASHPGATWRVALYHHDIYGVGSHASTSGYGDSVDMQPTWGPFMDRHNIDIVVNGHDHIYGRSKFMKGDEVVLYQMPTVLDRDHLGITEKNPGTYILPDGTLYMALGAAGTKRYDPYVSDWLAYTPGRINVSEYSIMEIEGDKLTFTTYRIDTDAVVDSVTLKKTADYADLQRLITSSEAVPAEGITTESWTAFQAAITAAESVASDAAPTVIHNAFVSLYTAYYALEMETDKTALGTLISEVTALLASTVEGQFTGQYGEGQKAILQGILEDAVIVYNTRLATQAEVDAEVSKLGPARAAYLATEGSAVPPSFMPVTDIGADGPQVLELINWMADTGEPFFVATDQERYSNHYTKQDFAKDTFGAMRNDQLYGPYNLRGGRGDIEAYISKTHIGTWIRYELNVAEEGMYEVKLGALNKTATAQSIVLRDDQYNILSAFTVAAGAVGHTWEDNAQDVTGSDEIYLAQGKNIIELYFINDATSQGANPAYPDGPDIDILTFERTGDGTPPDFTIGVGDGKLAYVLPLPSVQTGGAAVSQRGWRAGGSDSSPGLTVAELKAATHLVVEVAAQPNSGTLQLHLCSDGNDFTWTDTAVGTGTAHWQSAQRRFYIDLSVYREGLDNDFAAWRGMTNSGYIDLSYYNWGWDALNVMRAYLVLDEALYLDLTAPCEDCGEYPCECVPEDSREIVLFEGSNSDPADWEGWGPAVVITNAGSFDGRPSNIAMTAFRQAFTQDTLLAVTFTKGSTPLMKFFKNGVAIEPENAALLSPGTNTGGVAVFTYASVMAYLRSHGINSLTEIDVIFINGRGDTSPIGLTVTKVAVLTQASAPPASGDDPPGGGAPSSPGTTPDPDPEPETGVEVELSEEQITEIIDAIDDAIADALEEIAELLEAESGETVVVSVVLELGAEVDADTAEVSFTVPDTVADAIAAAIEAMEEAIEDGASIDFTVTLDLGVAALTLDLEALAEVFGGDEAPVLSIVIEQRQEESVEELLAGLDEDVAAMVEGRKVISLIITVGGVPVTDFGGGAVDVVIPYTLGEDEDSNAVLVKYLGKDEPELMRSYYDDGFVYFSTKHFSMFVIAYKPVTFTDVIPDWAAAHAAFAGARGLFVGNEAGEFLPHLSITYQQLAAVLANYMGLGGELDWGSGDHNTWGKDFGLFGDLDVEFSAVATRADMAYIIYNFIVRSGVKVSPRAGVTFTDLGGLDDAYVAAIEFLAGRGIVNGTGGTGFSPDLTVDRAQVAAIVANIVKAFGQ